MDKVILPVFFGAFSLFGLVFMGFWLLIFGVSIFGTVLWIWMLVDVVKRDFKKEDEKIIWVLVVILTHWIGALIYYFTIKKKDKKTKKK